MYYVYILKHPTEERIYIGLSTDLRSRLKRHRSEHPVWRLAYYEAYASEADATARELRLKAKVFGQRVSVIKESLVRQPPDRNRLIKLQRAHHGCLGANRR